MAPPVTTRSHVGDEEAQPQTTFPGVGDHLTERQMQEELDKIGNIELSDRHTGQEEDITTNPTAADKGKQPAAGPSAPSLADRVAQLTAENARRKQQLADATLMEQAATIAATRAEENAKSVTEVNEDLTQDMHAATELAHTIIGEGNDQQRALLSLPSSPAPLGLHQKLLHAVANKPPTFDGVNSKLPVVEWLLVVKSYCVLMGITDTFLLAQVAVSYLRGDAVLAYQSVPKRWSNPLSGPTWLEFVEVMRNRWEMGHFQIQARLKLDELYQGKQPMPQYIQEFDRLCAQVDLPDFEKIHLLLTHMRKDCAQRVEVNPATGLRWTDYLALRKYALSCFPLSAAAETLGRRIQGGQQQYSSNSNKRGAGAGGDTSRSAKRHQSSGPKPKAFVREPNGTMRFTGAANNTAKRSSIVASFTKEHGLCPICYGKLGANNHPTQFAQCAKPPRSGDPPGFHSH